MSPATAAALVSTSPWCRVRQTLAWKIKKVAKAVGGGTYLSLRERLLARKVRNRQ
jgi:hypothetical protein